MKGVCIDNFITLFFLFSYLHSNDSVETEKTYILFLNENELTKLCPTKFHIMYLITVQNFVGPR